VLSFCEHGELQGALKKRAADDRRRRLLGHGQVQLLQGGGGWDGPPGAAQRFVRRDLAARNVLLGSGMFCNLADFGRRVQTGNNTGDHHHCRGSSGTIPVRWTAPEGVSSQKFSSASDLWRQGTTCV